MMGDNSDNSADSCSWAFCQKNIIGKANHVLMSYDTSKHPLRWGRMGEKIF